jgi:hypothetical protein
MNIAALFPGWGRQEVRDMPVRERNYFNEQSIEYFDAMKRGRG